jgi:hypothetical protein
MVIVISRLVEGALGERLTFGSGQKLLPNCCERWLEKWSPESKFLVVKFAEDDFDRTFYGG